MLVRPDQLATHLAKTLAPLYVLHGDEPLLVAEAGDAVRRAARGRGYTDREVIVTTPSFKWDALRIAAANLSLFGGNKLVDLRIPSGRPGREGGEALIRYCADLGEGVVTLVSLPRLDWQARKTAWFQTMQQAGITVELNAPPLERLPDWIAGRLARQAQTASAEGLDFIARHVEGNLLAAHQEIQKLALLHPAGPLTIDQIKDAVLNVARYDVDKLRAALLEGDIGRCARLLDGLRAEGTGLPLVLWAFATDLRELAWARGALDVGRPVAPALRAQRVFDAAHIGLVERAARVMTKREVQAGLRCAAHIDRVIKGLAAGDPWDELQQLALRLGRANQRESRNH